MKDSSAPRLARLAPWTLTLLLGAAGCLSATPQPEAGSVAQAYLDVGRIQEAAREIELAVRSTPSDVDLRQRAAGIHEEAGDLDRAIGHLEMALQVAPRDPEISIRIGELERARDNTEDAYVAFRRASELAPSDVRAVSGLAMSADALGFKKEADAAYARWSQLEREAANPVLPPR